MIYILEGADGTGKSTLAAKIAEATGGNVLHQTYNKDWNMELYHRDVMRAALVLQRFQPIVLDRWAPSEAVYGPIFRGKPAYNIETMIAAFYGLDIKWVYCRNDNAAENHRQNMKKRVEMFDDMTQVTKDFDEYVKKHPQLKWRTFDFDKMNTETFIEGLLTDE